MSLLWSADEVSIELGVANEGAQVDHLIVGYPMLMIAFDEGAFPDFRPQKLSGIDHLRRPEWRLHAAEGGYSVRARRPTSGVISCGA